LQGGRLLVVAAFDEQHRRMYWTSISRAYWLQAA
jgi:hypothetical protein